MDTGYFFLAPYLADGDDDDMEGGRVGLSKFRPWRRPPKPGGDAAPALEKKVPLSMRPRQGKISRREFSEKTENSVSRRGPVFLIIARNFRLF